MPRPTADEACSKVVIRTQFNLLLNAVYLKSCGDGSTRRTHIRGPVFFVRVFLSFRGHLPETSCFRLAKLVLHASFASQARANVS